MGFEIGQLGKWAQSAVKKTPARRTADQSRSEARLEQQLRVMKLPPGERNRAVWKELLGRHWQADFCWLNQGGETKRHLAVFIDGQVHAIRGKRSADCERDNVLSTYLPKEWTVWRFTAEQVHDLVAVDAIAAWLSGDTQKALEALQRKASFR